MNLSLPTIAFRNSTLLVCAFLVSASIVLVPSLSRADSQWQRIVQQCAAYVSCPSNLTPSQARSIRGMGVSLEQSLRWCAAGYGCPDGTTRERAQSVHGTPELTGDEQNAALIRCSTTGICPDAMTPSDAEMFIETVRTSNEIDATEQAHEDHTQLLDQVRICAGGGRCPLRLNQDAAQEIYSTPTRVDRTIRLCASNMGCPPNLSPTNADFVFGDQGPVTRADINFSLHRCARTGVCPPDITPEIAQNLMREVPSPELRPVYACAETGLCSDGMSPEDAIAQIQNEQNLEAQWPNPPEEDAEDLNFEDEAENQQRNDEETSEVELTFSPFETAGPIAVSAVVEAAMPNQQIPDYAGLNDFIAQRLPSFFGNDLYETSLARAPTQQLTLSPGATGEIAPALPLEPSQSETHEVVGYPEGAPPSITLSRANERSGARGDASARSSLVITRPDNGGWGLDIRAEIRTDQFSIEDEGAAQIGSRPRTRTGLLAYIPVDRGGPARRLGVYVNATFTGGSGQFSIVPYSDSSQSSPALIGQLLQVQSQQSNFNSQETELAHALLEQLSGLTGVSTPDIGNTETLERFEFGATPVGIQRGFLVSFEASAAPEILSTLNTVRNYPVRLGRVTEITERTDFSFRGQIVVIPE